MNSHWFPVLGFQGTKSCDRNKRELDPDDQGRLEMMDKMLENLTRCSGRMRSEEEQRGKIRNGKGRGGVTRDEEE